MCSLFLMLKDHLFWMVINVSSGNYFLLMDYGGNINLGKPHLSLISNLPTSFCGSITKTQIIVFGEENNWSYSNYVFFPYGLFLPKWIFTCECNQCSDPSYIWISSSSIHQYIPHNCHFWYATTFFRPVKGTPKKCVNLRQKLSRDKTA